MGKNNGPETSVIAQGEQLNRQGVSGNILKPCLDGANLKGGKKISEMITTLRLNFVRLKLPFGKRVLLFHEFVVGNPHFTPCRVELIQKYLG